MKKFTYLVLTMLFVLSLCSLSGCSFFADAKAPEIIESYPSEEAPSQVIKTEKFWAMLFNTYSGHDYSIRVGETPDALREVYNVEDVTIWYFKADNNAIVWCEKSDEFYTYKLYEIESQKVKTIHQDLIDAGFQAMNVGIFDNTAYYCLVDYEKKDVSVLAYDIAAETTTAVQCIPFEEEHQPYNINVEDEYLNFGCANHIKVINLTNSETVFETSLPENVVYTYSVSYDSKNDVCALYYADEDSEDIGIIKEGETEISSICTFNENYYAFREEIECHDGHIYWVFQANVSGMVADHYTFVDYNYLEHRPIETKRTLDFFCYGSELYSLRYDEREYTHINLCKY